MDPGRLEVNLLTRDQTGAGNSSRYHRIPLRNKMMSQSSNWLQRPCTEKSPPVKTNRNTARDICLWTDWSGTRVQETNLEVN